jgi:alkaline phosphatase
MSSLRKYLTTTMAVVLVFAVNLVAYAESNSLERAKGVILFIGDGMGINQLSSADIYAKRVLGRDLMINSIRTSGLTTTHAANSEITDSAAA